MGFIGGDLRESFIGRVEGADPGKLLAVPIDVGKNSAAAMVCDFWGEIISPPFAFELNERGFQDFAVTRGTRRGRARRLMGPSGARASGPLSPSTAGSSRLTGSRSPCSTLRRSRGSSTVASTVANTMQPKRSMSSVGACATRSTSTR